MGKIIKKGAEVQEELLKGIKKVSDAVKTTMGPSGKCVALTGVMGPDVTRDGATVAKSIELSDPIQNMGAELVKNAAVSTEDKVGDGTSTTSILVYELVSKGRGAISNGANVNEIKSGMQKAEKWITGYIKSQSTQVGSDLEKIKKVATISANNDPEVGDLVVEGMKKVGINGLITVDTTSGLDTVIDVTTGMKLGRGWASPLYVTNPADGTCVMDNPFVLVVGEKISSVNQLVEILKAITDPSLGGASPLLIVCDDIDDNVSTMLIYNVTAGALRCCVVKGVDFGDSRKNLMADLAIATGAQYFCPENGISVSKANLSDLGRAGKVVISRDSCILYDVKGDEQAIQDRANIIKARLEDPSTSSYDKDKFSKRLANLTGGIAIIKAGGASETEKNNRKATIEDSVLASRSAIEEGCSPGGGSVFNRCSIEVRKDKKFWKGLTRDEAEGAEIVFSSLPIILRTIAENSGMSGDLIMEKSKTWKPGIGYNAKTREIGVDLVSEGILDSTKSLRVAIENSISAASMILLIDQVVVDEPEKPKE